MNLKIKSKKSFAIYELLISIIVIAILSGGLFALSGRFQRRRRVAVAVDQLLVDLRLTQQFARTLKDGHKFYGLRFYDGLGENNDRIGYKIVRYEDPGGGDPLDFDGPVDPDDSNWFTIVKGPDPNDINTPELIDDTFFNVGVEIDPTSEFQVVPAGLQRHSIIFTPKGSATSNGDSLLTTDNDRIILRIDNYQKAIEIISLTGYVRIQ